MKASPASAANQKLVAKLTALVAKAQKLVESTSPAKGATRKPKVKAAAKKSAAKPAKKSSAKKKPARR